MTYILSCRNFIHINNIRLFDLINFQKSDFMKFFGSIPAIAALLLLCSNGIQAQTTQTKLNQVELMKQFIGYWKSDFAKDTTRFWDVKPYGTGLECTYKSVTNGKIVVEGKELYGYNKSIDRCINVGLIKGKDIEVYKFWFASKDKYILIPYSEISSPEKKTFKAEGEFKSPDLIVETITLNNKTLRIDTWTRVK